MVTSRPGVKRSGVHIGSWQHGLNRQPPNGSFGDRTVLISRLRLDDSITPPLEAFVVQGFGLPAADAHVCAGAPATA